MNNDEILTTKELAKRWKVDANWIYRSRFEMNIPHFKLGTHYRYRLSEIEEFESGSSFNK